MSRRPDGRRGRRKPDPAEETASWLLEVERAGQQPDDDEEGWAGTLRATRREATGQFPRVPSEGRGGAPSANPAQPPQPPSEARRPPPAEPPAGQQGDWFVSSRPEQPSGRDAGSWGGTTVQGGLGAHGADPGYGTAGPWRQADRPRAPEPPAQEPQAWDTHAEAEAWNGRWPFEETSQSWEPDDRSYTWPAQELPSNTGSWEAEPSSAPSQDPWASTQGGYPGPPGYEATGGYQAGGYQAVPPASGYTDPGYGADAGHSTGGYDSAGGYDTTGGYQTDSGYSANGADGYSTDTGGGYPAADGYAPSSGAPPAGEPYPAADSSTSRDPYATGEHYAAREPYGTGGAHGSTDPGAGHDPRHAADPYAAGEPYPGHDPFAAYGLQHGSSGPYGAGEGTQAGGSSSQPGYDSGPRTGPIGAGPLQGSAAARPSTPPRPEIWPPQTGTWQVDEPPPRPRPSASGEFSRLLDSEEEQVVRLGRSRDDRGGGTGPLDLGPRVHGGRSNRAPEARLLDDGGHVSHRARWPRVVALISWIILLMVLCWFYVFPWLEKILPENF